MNRRRSPLDTINAGRQRRPAASADDLDRTLARLEGRPAPRERLDAHDSRYETPRRAGSYGFMQELKSGREAMTGVTRDLERHRRQEDGFASVSRITEELRAMREELRAQMNGPQVNGGLQREFETVRSEIRRLAASARQTEPGELGPEIERLSESVRALSSRSDDRSIGMLRLELEQVRKALDAVAREDTVKSVDRRWDDFDRKWDAFEEKQQSRASGPDLKALGQQIERIVGAMSDIPDGRALRSLEEKVRELASSIAQIASHRSLMGPDTIEMIEARLDEISRAIVASTSASRPVSFDPAPFERIEARMSALASQIDELVDDRGGAAVIEHINHLASRVDDIAHRIELPEAMVERLAGQMALIVDKLDNEPPAADIGLVFQNLEARFEHLSDRLERRQDDALLQGEQLFRELERRLEDVAGHLDRQPAIEPDRIMHAIDQRFTDLAARLEENRAEEERHRANALERQLADMAGRLDASARAAGIDPSIIRNLESQIAGLSAHLAQPGQPLPEFDDIAPRLDHIERAISGNRDALLDAAREVASDAARAIASGASAASGPAEQQMVSELTSELRSLEQLTRRSDERNARTFEAIHDTLLKIVDRLGSLEGGSPAKASFGTAPSIEPEAEDYGFAPDTREAAGAVRRSPAQAAAAAADHALKSDKAPAPAPNTPLSMLGGLTRAFTRRPADAEPALPAAEPRLAGDAELDAPLDPAVANQPLEPGSGAPDIGAIMRRVRDERGQRPGQPADAAKSDFIAAARRAAQAAAADADIAKADGEASARGGLKFGGLFRNKRKTALLAATALMVVVAGAQLSGAFLGDNAPQPAPQPQVAEAPQMQLEEQGPAAEAGAVSDEADSVAAAADEAPRQAAPARQAGQFVAAAIGQDEAEGPDLIIEDLQSADTGPAAEQPLESAALAVETAPLPAGIGAAALRDAAEAGDAKAMYEIGTRYAEGRGVAADPAAASDWFTRAAQIGFAPAQYRLGSHYEKGIGVTRDVAQARQWYRRAAEQGNASAMHNLAVLLAMGSDGPADNQGAARWFLEAAELGVRDSQFNLGILAAKGAGVPQSLEEAYKWFALVAQAGDRDAATKRDEVGKALRPEQLDKAKAAAALWKPRAVDPQTNAVDIPDEWSDGVQHTASVDMRQAVLNIQTILNGNGYDAGPADGVMGARTKTAIADFQKANGMVANGEVTEELVQALLALR